MILPHRNYGTINSRRRLGPAESSFRVRSSSSSTIVHCLLTPLTIYFSAHNILTPQPVHNPAVFFLRMIMHDWSDEDCVKILSHLRAAAGPNTHLVVSENIVEYACAQPDDLADIPGAVLPPAPAPLLANYGSADLFAYLMDLQVSLHNNSAILTLMPISLLRC